jgi:ubiquinone/menaquinone biosynthesis C-methylase UbiE
VARRRTSNYDLKGQSTLNCVAPSIDILGGKAMSAVEANVQSAQYVDFWNDILVPKFIKYKHILVDGLTHHSEAIFPSLPVKEGDKVLDVGCGFGDTALKLAQRVGPRGKVVGLDCCEAFLDYGRRDAKKLGLQNLSFINGDALLYRFEPEYDFVFSRFGTMFFANPVAGLRNMRKALKPGGIMTHIVWRTRADNPWLSMAKDIVLKFLPPPGEDALTCGPGPFSMADEASVSKMMEIAGYKDITFKRVDAPVLVGKTVQDAIDFQLAIGPAGEVFREAGQEAEAKRGQIEAALAEAINGQKKEADGIVMESSSWIISGRNPN